MRIRNKYPIGLILLTRILFLYNAVAFTIPFQSRTLQSAIPMRFQTRFSAHSNNESPIIPTTSEITSVENMLHPIVEKKKNRKYLFWACVLLAIAEKMTGKSIQINSPSLVFSTVSASLLRSSASAGYFSARQLLNLVFLAFQISQIGTMIKTISMLSSSISTWYIGCLANFPLYTKAFSSAAIGFLGDSASQYFEERKRVKREESRISLRNYDRRRGLSVVVDGLFFTGPLLHICYGFMENLIPTSGSIMPASIAAITQVLIDDIFIDSFFVCLSFLNTGFAEGYGLQTFSQLKKDFIPAIKGAWATSFLLMPLEFLCFRFLPVSFRVLGMNFIDIIWGAVLSYKVHKNRKRNSGKSIETPNSETLAFVN